MCQSQGHRPRNQEDGGGGSGMSPPTLNVSLQLFMDLPGL